MHRQGLDSRKSRAFRRADPIVEEKSYPLDLEIADDKSMRAVFSGRNVFASVVLSVPGRRKRIAADIEFIDVCFAKKDAHQFSLRIVNTEADRAIERRRNEEYPNTSW